ncbi:MAG: hypothetical protein JSV20_08825 [Candidatus Bathyarchaeota archaeon]|nr:MAG: hypothetical protein JSV20_08825 [Candidatus Bathyarchaeota archaeon]
MAESTAARRWAEGPRVSYMAMPHIAEPGCENIGHKLHLCDMVERGEASLEQIKALIKNPQFICKKCGRVAAKLENLCEPESLDHKCGACGMTFKTKEKLMAHAKAHK